MDVLIKYKLKKYTQLLKYNPYNTKYSYKLEKYKHLLTNNNSNIEIDNYINNLKQILMKNNKNMTGGNVMLKEYDCNRWLKDIKRTLKNNKSNTEFYDIVKLVFGALIGMLGTSYYYKNKNKIREDKDIECEEATTTRSSLKFQDISHNKEELINIIRQLVNKLKEFENVNIENQEKIKECFKRIKELLGIYTDEVNYDIKLSADGS
jgi:hypothetical protein